MDPVKNPFAPGAGTPPPELAGRDDIIRAATITLERIRLGRAAQSLMMLGLRCTGKTVLLNRIAEIAAEKSFFVVSIEAQEDSRFLEALCMNVTSILKQLSAQENLKYLANETWSALKSFVSTFKVSHNDWAFQVNAAPGIADSGDLEIDLTQLFERLGQLLKTGNRALAMCIDEVQYLQTSEISATIVALHKSTQQRLPIIFIGAGLPQVAAFAGNAKSYAERLFMYHKIGELGAEEAAQAVRNPIEEENEEIHDDALKQIIVDTEGYPYFLQEWGSNVWDVAEQSPITIADVHAAKSITENKLDNGFFRVRLERLTSQEQAYVFAMSDLGHGPYRTADIADHLGKDRNALGVFRQNIIKKGMIYQPSHGYVDFTVPLFVNYLNRVRPDR